MFLSWFQLANCKFKFEAEAELVVVANVAQSAEQKIAQFKKRILQKKGFFFKFFFVQSNLEAWLLAAYHCWPDQNMQIKDWTMQKASCLPTSKNRSKWQFNQLAWLNCAFEAGCFLQAITQLPNYRKQETTHAKHASDRTKPDAKSSPQSAFIIVNNNLTIRRNRKRRVEQKTRLVGKFRRLRKKRVCLLYSKWWTKLLPLGFLRNKRFFFCSLACPLCVR